MKDNPEQKEARSPANCDIVNAAWQLGPFDLSVPTSGRDMPDVQLEALCDIIFANLTMTKLPQR